MPELGKKGVVLVTHQCLQQIKQSVKSYKTILEKAFLDKYLKEKL